MEFRKKSKIKIYNYQKDLSISSQEIKKALSLLLCHLCVTTDELILHFVTQKKISQLHNQFFNDPSPTDCISIPIDTPEEKQTGYHLLGEIFVCAKIAKEYAQAHQLNVYRELIRYVIHGLLHLIGYDDMQLKDRRKMKAKEEECLKILRKMDCFKGGL